MYLWVAVPDGDTSEGFATRLLEHGVLAGMSVEAQVRPYVNTETLAASHVELKSFFMKVTKVYP